MTNDEARMTKELHTVRAVSGYPLIVPCLLFDIRHSDFVISGFAGLGYDWGYGL